MRGLADDLPLFASVVERKPKSKSPSRLEEALGDLHPDEMTPRDALEALYRLKKVLDEGSD